MADMAGGRADARYSDAYIPSQPCPGRHLFFHREPCRAQGIPGVRFTSLEVNLTPVDRGGLLLHRARQHRGAGRRG